MSIYRTDYRNMTREVLLVAFKRLCIMKYDDLGKMDGLTISCPFRATKN